MSRPTADIVADLRACLDESDSSHDTSMWLLRDAADRLAELDAALRYQVEHEDQPCRFDHHGYCQDHPGGFGDEGCAIARSRQVLGLSHSRIAPPT